MTDEPVRFVVTFPPGGPTLLEPWEWVRIVDKRPCPACRKAKVESGGQRTLCPEHLEEFHEVMGPQLRRMKQAGNRRRRERLDRLLDAELKRGTPFEDLPEQLQRRALAIGRRREYQEAVAQGEPA